MSDKPFTFEGCDSPAVCREGIRPLLGAGMDWSEVHCGRCGQQGIVRHSDLLSVPPAPPLATPDPDGAPVEVIAPAEPASLPEDAEASAPPAETGRTKR